MSEHSTLNGAEIRVRQVIVDSVSQTPAVILQTVDGHSEFPLYMNVMDASSIIFELQAMESARPMPHDLMGRLVAVLGGEVERVIIDDVQDDSFLATLFVRRDNQVFALDARPSDAIALALRSKARIFVSETVLLHASRATSSAGQGSYPA